MSDADILTAAYIAASEGSDDVPDIVRMDGHTYRAMGGDIPDELLHAVLQLTASGELTVTA